MFRTFFGSRKWAPRAYGWGLALLVVLIAQVLLSVQFNTWYGDFFNLLQKAIKESGRHHYDEFVAEFLNLKWILPLYIALLPIANWLARKYAFFWRTALTHDYIERWRDVAEKIEGASQRIQEDTDRLAKIVDDLGVQAVRAILTLIMFTPILWRLSFDLHIPYFSAIPGMLVWIALLISVGGSIASWFVGIKLPKLQYNNQVVEAAYRKELVLAEDNKVTYGSPEVLFRLYGAVTRNTYRLFLHYMYYDVWSTFYLEAATLVPLVIPAYAIAAGTITLGVLIQIGNVFDKVRESCSLFIENLKPITELRSIYVRLSEFEAKLERHTTA